MLNEKGALILDNVETMTESACSRPAKDVCWAISRPCWGYMWTMLSWRWLSRCRAKWGLCSGTTGALIQDNVLDYRWAICQASLWPCWVYAVRCCFHFEKTLWAKTTRSIRSFDRLMSDSAHTHTHTLHIHNWSLQLGMCWLLKSLATGRQESGRCGTSKLTLLSEVQWHWNDRWVENLWKPHKSHQKSKKVVKNMEMQTNFKINRWGKQIPKAIADTSLQPLQASSAWPAFQALVHGQAAPRALSAAGAHRHRQRGQRWISSTKTTMNLWEFMFFFLHSERIYCNYDVACIGQMTCSRKEVLFTTPAILQDQFFFVRGDFVESFWLLSRVRHLVRHFLARCICLLS